MSAAQQPDAAAEALGASEGGSEAWCFDEEADGGPREPPVPDLTPDPRDTAHEPGEREEEQALI